jgi:hypothetical protein
MFENKFPILPFDKRAPVKKQTDTKNKQESFDHLLPENGWPCLLQLRYNKGHGIAHCEQKKWENKVGWGASMPGCMLQRSINMAPTTGVVYQYHQRYRGAAENIK